MKRNNGFLIAAAVILGLTALYWLYQAVGLMISGATFGTYSFFILLAVLMLILLFVSRRRPLLVGIIVAGMGILLAVYFLMVKLNLYDATPFLLLMCVPLSLSGLLFIEADWSMKRKNA
jgi:peptidoglycan/LPS O-acetylase OafA/YrhL